MLSRFLGAFLLTCAVACGPDPARGPPPLGLPEGCQPLLSGQDCLLPYPSDFFRAGDRVEAGGAARLLTDARRNADVTTGSVIDGFSRVPTIVASLFQPVGTEGWVRLADPPERSVADTSPTVILDAETGERIPHFVDLDPRAKDPARQAIVLHPMVGLRESARYVVALRGIRAPDGAPIPAPEGFRRLRDGDVGDDPNLRALAPRYEGAVFGALESAGVSRGDLTLAWDFTTGSDASAMGDMLRIRELTLRWLETHRPTVTVEELQTDPEPGVWRRIRGHLEGPLFTASAEPGAPLARGPDGQVQQNGTTRLRFVAIVPSALRGRSAPARALLYGHGFFGSLGEVEGRAVTRIAEHTGSVVVGVEWWGMHVSDIGKVADALTGPVANVFDAFERVHQSMANWIVAARALRTSLREHEALQRSAADGGPPGAPLVTDAPPGYVGISQGHILGGTMLALNPEVDRAVLQVGGCGFTHMMMRARPFATYLSLLEVAMKDPLEQQKFIAVSQRMFDRFDPATYARLVLNERLPGTSEQRRVLLQIGLGDTQVPNLASYLHARLLGVPLLLPSPVMPWGIPTVAAPVDGSAMTLFDFGLDTGTLYREPVALLEETPVHEGLRREIPVLDQLARFLQHGTVVHPCDGPCDPR